MVFEAVVRLLENRDADRNSGCCRGDTMAGRAVQFLTEDTGAVGFDVGL